MKSQFLSIALCIACSAAGSVGADFPRLIWQDEFDGNSLDPAKWE